MEKTKEDIRIIIINELTQQMAEDGKRMGVNKQIIEAAINAAQVNIANLAEKILNKIYN